MAEYGEYQSFTARTAADFRSRQYHIVRFTAARTVDIASNAAATAVLGGVGVIQTKVDSGRACEVGYLGESKVVAGGSLTVNVLITNNGSGRAAAAGSGDIVIGRVLQAAGANGDVVSALLVPPFRMIGA